jgi:hypothetical protein
MPLTQMLPDGTFQFLFHAGQWRVMESRKRFILALAGTQSGKTETGPPWLYREIRERGPGDYLMVAPNYPLLQKKAIPAFCSLFGEEGMGLGRYVSSSRQFIYHDKKTRIFFGYAENPDSLESATAKAAWLDEAGQKGFRLASWEAILRRLSINEGRALITSTPYDLGWLKQKLFDPWERSKRNHPLIDVIQFDSIANPAFPRAEYERARRDLPRWKFDMFYRGRFARPAGMIYDCWEDAVHKVRAFAIPDTWPRFLGLDFGGVNTAGVFLAQELAEVRVPGLRWDHSVELHSTGRYFAYREYKAGSRTAKEHVEALLAGEPTQPHAVGGSASEEQWRAEFSQAGLAVHQPEIKDVEVGIDRAYGGLKRGQLLVFEDLDGLLDEIGSYSRELNDAGEPTEKIADKETYHHLDALRYIGTHLWREAGEPDASEPMVLGTRYQ